MNQLDLKPRAAVVACLAKGNSIRAMYRMTGVARNTVDNRDGEAAYHFMHDLAGKLANRNKKPQPVVVPWKRHHKNKFAPTEIYRMFRGSALRLNRFHCRRRMLILGFANQFAVVARSSTPPKL